MVPPSLPALFDPFPPTPPGRPDSALASHIYSDSNRVVVTDHLYGVFPRDLIWVAFTPESTTAEREAAVEAIRGRVIGGDAVSPHAFYFVQIIGDSTDTPLWQAMRHLEALPQVRGTLTDPTFLIPGYAPPGMY